MVTCCSDNRWLCAPKSSKLVIIQLIVWSFERRLILNVEDVCWSLFVDLMLTRKE